MLLAKDRVKVKYFGIGAVATMLHYVLDGEVGLLLGLGRFKKTGLTRLKLYLKTSLSHLGLSKLLLLGAHDADCHLELRSEFVSIFGRRLELILQASFLLGQ